jgi:V/A-type H+-transporting ATPase subunit D
MAESRVDATRMELLRQRRRLAMARRGHRLLENKRDEMMHRFLELVERARGLRERVEEELVRGLRRFLAARAEMLPEALHEALMAEPAPDGRPPLSVTTESVMNVLVPRFELQHDRKAHSYGLATPSAQLDEALRIFAEVLPEMIRMAEVEQAIELLAEEIEKTRRRVNALEQILIPQLERNIRYIAATLDEMERASRAQLLRIKERLE